MEVAKPRATPAPLRAAGQIARWSFGAGDHLQRLRTLDLAEETGIMTDDRARAGAGVRSRHLLIACAHTIIIADRPDRCEGCVQGKEIAAQVRWEIYLAQVLQLLGEGAHQSMLDRSIVD